MTVTTATSDRVRALLADVPTDLLIDGEWVPAASGRRIDVVNPATEEPIASVADGGDLSAAQSQKAAMALAKRSLAEATAAAVQGNAGYRAVSAMPSLAGGHPVAEVPLVRGDDWKVVTERLD